MEPYLEKIKADAETLIKNEFPKKALELDGIINSKLLATSMIEEVLSDNQFPSPQDYVTSALTNIKSDDTNGDSTEDPQAKKRKREAAADQEISGCKVILFPNGLIKSNQKIVELLQLIKPYITHFLDSSAILKLWIQILIPQVEDFKAELSLQVQEDSLSEIRAIEAEVATYHDHVYKYYTVRGKLIEKMAKYPHVADFRQSINEFDEKMFMTARLVTMELRNHYTSVHDILTKNLEKIKKPRSDAPMHSMY